MFRIIDWVERLYVRIVYGPEDSDPELVQALDRAFRYQPDDFVDSWLQDFQRKDRLSQELANAKWILEHEKRLADLQTKIAAQRQAGVNTDRLQEHHLAGLRRNISRD